MKRLVSILSVVVMMFTFTGGALKAQAADDVVITPFAMYLITATTKCVNVDSNTLYYSTSVIGTTDVNRIEVFVELQRLVSGEWVTIHSFTASNNAATIGAEKNFCSSTYIKKGNQYRTKSKNTLYAKGTNVVYYTYSSIITKS